MFQQLVVPYLYVKTKRKYCGISANIYKYRQNISQELSNVPFENKRTMTLVNKRNMKNTSSQNSTKKTKI